MGWGCTLRPDACSGPSPTTERYAIATLRCVPSRSCCRCFTRAFPAARPIAETCRGEQTDDDDGDDGDDDGDAAAGMNRRS